MINVNKDERSIDFEIVGMVGTRRREPSEGRRVFKTGSSDRKPRNQTGVSKSIGRGDGKESGTAKSTAKKKNRNKKHYENAPKVKRKKKR